MALGELDPGRRCSARAHLLAGAFGSPVPFAHSEPYLRSPFSSPSRMNLEKLKDSARKFEQKEDWRKAIEVYLKAIQQIESGAETSPDLSLYNRVGDLYLKINDTAAAVRSYERAVDLYADQGFFNNAIALCGKILRVNPGRTQTYLKLAQLHARKNVVIEAKRNLIEFLERMNALGQLDQAFQSVKEFADQFSGSQEIRMMLVELLRAASREEEALEQLAKIAGDLELAAVAPRSCGAGRRGRRWAAPARHAAPHGTPVRRPRLPRHRVRRAGDAARGGGAHRSRPMSVDAPPPEGSSSRSRTTVEEPRRRGHRGPEETMRRPRPSPSAWADSRRRAPAADLSFEGLPRRRRCCRGHRGGRGPVEASSIRRRISTCPSRRPKWTSPRRWRPWTISISISSRTRRRTHAVGRGLPLIEAGADARAGIRGGAGGEVAELEDRIVDDPDNPDLHRELADRLLLVRRAGPRREELRLALEGYERAEDWPGATGIADRLVVAGAGRDPAPPEAGRARLPHR